MKRWLCVMGLVAAAGLPGWADNEPGDVDMVDPHTVPSRGGNYRLTEGGRARVEHLRCEYLTDPLGIDVVEPRLSWTTESPSRGWKQGAYQVLAASSAEILEQDRGDLWDSGKVASDQSAHVVYGGKPLTSRMRCFWKLRVWDADGKVSGWSKPATWSMGLLVPEDWQDAQWIGWDREPEPDAAHKPPQITITRARYGVPGDAAKQVDLAGKIQKQVAEGTFKVKASNDFAGGDPAHGIKKKLELDYTLDGKAIQKVVDENAEVDLSNGKKPAKRYLPAPHLRKEFSVRAGIKRATVYVTAQGIVELHLNGKRVSDEVFMPGWTDYRKRIYYRAYDVTEMLRPGPNALGAILGDGWFRGNISCIGQNQYGSRLRFKTQLHIDCADGRSEVVVSDPSWKASFGPIRESDMQHGETYDARLEMPGWTRAGYDDHHWSAVDTGADLQQALLQAYPGVPVRRTQELPTQELTEPKAGHFVFDLGQNFSGWIRLKLQGNSGDKVVMRFAEMLNDDGTVYTANLRSARATDTYILKGGAEEVWEPHFTFHGFRYVELTGLSGTPTPDTVTGIVVHSDAPESASFACSNPMLNRLHSNIVWGQRSNYLEVPTDCPQRDERLGWTGDTQVFIRTGCYNQDVSAYFTKWIVDLMDSQNAQGLFGNQAPVFHGHGAPAWACAGIISPWTLYRVYGDTRVIEQCYDAMARYIEARGEKGLGGRGWTWGDWLAPGERPPRELISTAYFAYTTSLMAEMAEVLGKSEDAATYRKLFEDIRGYFQETYVAEDGTITSNLQTVYCMALQYDLLTDAQRKQAAAHLVERIKARDYHLSVGFLGIPILLPTLTDIGRNDLAYRLIQNTTYPSWGYSIEQGATTIWERWNSYSKDKGFGDAKMNSFNHYALGACGEWMFRSMLGIDSDGAGFKKIIMKPELGEGVTWVNGHYDSIHGRIESDWKMEGDRFDWNITVPANTRATVYVPAVDAASVTESGRAVNEAEGVTFLRMEKGRAVFEVGSGTYAFGSGIK